MEGTAFFRRRGQRGIQKSLTVPRGAFKRGYQNLTLFGVGLLQTEALKKAGHVKPNGIQSNTTHRFPRSVCQLLILPQGLYPAQDPGEDDQHGCIDAE